MSAPAVASSIEDDPSEVRVNDDNDQLTEPLLGDEDNAPEHVVAVSNGGRVGASLPTALANILIAVLGAGQGLPLLHFSAQPEPLLSQSRIRALQSSHRTRAEK